MTNEWLSDARKIPDDVMSYIRKIAVRAVVEFGWSPECVYKIFGISRSCLYDWLSSFRRGGYEALETRLPPGAEPLITREMDVWLKWVVLSRTPSDYGYDTALWTCGILAALLAREFGVEVIGATVNAHLKKLELSYQVPRYRASEQDPVEIERFLNDTFPRVKRYAEKRGAEIAFEDEAGVHLDAHAGRTWGARGETPEVIATDKRGKFNVLSIVTPEGNLQFSLKAGNIDSDTYIGQKGRGSSFCLSITPPSTAQRRCASSIVPIVTGSAFTSFPAMRPSTTRPNSFGERSRTTVSVDNPSKTRPTSRND